MSFLLQNLHTVFEKIWTTCESLVQELLHQVKIWQGELQKKYAELHACPDPYHIIEW